jgi:hypothetical protein
LFIRILQGKHPFHLGRKERVHGHKPYGLGTPTWEITRSVITREDDRNTKLLHNVICIHEQNILTKYGLTKASSNATLVGSCPWSRALKPAGHSRLFI